MYMMKNIFKIKPGNLYKFQTNFDNITYNGFCGIIVTLCALLYTIIFEFSCFSSFIIGMIFGIIYVSIGNFKFE